MIPKNLDKLLSENVLSSESDPVVEKDQENTKRIISKAMFDKCPIKTCTEKCEMFNITNGSCYTLPTW